MNFETSTPPEDGKPIIAYIDEGTCDQVEVHGGVAYKWRYGLTDEVFCTVDQVVKWRGCGGFDF